MKKLGFIGSGNMAEALMRGLIERKVFAPADLIASDVDAARRRKVKRALKVDTTGDNLEVLRNSRALLLAVKPQNIGEVLDGLAAVIGPAAAVADGRARKAIQRPLALKDRL